VGDLGLDGRIYIAGSVSIPRTGGDLPLMEATGAGSSARDLNGGRGGPPYER
jgi:hypothetical protein